MKEGVTGQQFTLGFQPRTLIAQDFDQRVERLKPGIGDGGIGQGPQSLGGLQFWGIGGEVDPLEQTDQKREDLLADLLLLGVKAA